MRGVGLASFVYGTGLYLMLTSPSDFGEPLHPREPTLATLARQHRERTMAGAVTPIYIREEPLPIRAHCTTYRARLARARWRQSDSSVARPTEYFLGRSAVGTCPGGHSGGCCRATGYRSPYSSFLRTGGLVMIDKWLRLGSSRRFVPSTYLNLYFPLPSFLRIAVILSPLSDCMTCMLRRMEATVAIDLKLGRRFARGGIITYFFVAAAPGAHSPLTTW
jgi:hypothetical protein